MHYSTCVVCGKIFPVDPKNTPKCCSKECRVLLRKQSIRSSVKICELCGEPFTSSSNTAKYCNRDHYRPCPVCGKPVLVERGKEYEPLRCCSETCSNKLRCQTCQDRYDVKVISQSEEMKKKLHDIAVDERVVQKRKLTSLQNWGVDNPVKSAEVRSKISATVSSKECQDKLKETNRVRYGVDFAMQCSDGLERYSRTIQEKYGVLYFCMTDECRRSQGNIISTINRHIGDILSQYGLEYEFETRIDNRSYDVHIKDTNVLLEADPTYTHNSIGNHWNKSGLDKNYHLDKSRIAAENGYRCVHIFDWDDIIKVIKLFTSKEVIYARNCIVKEIDVKTACEFEKQYHIQNDCRGQLVCLGLYHDNQLVELMTFGKPRYNRNYQWELLRLCTHSNYKIIGGASKLFIHFIRSTNDITSIISYCDKAKFDGSVYAKLGFTHVGDTEPQKVWSKGSKKITDNLLRQRGYDQLFNTDYGKNTNNEQLMLDNGWLPVYDCGQATYVYEPEDLLEHIIVM